jgi:potassium-dependent mechanosensitive channel
MIRWPQMLRHCFVAFAVVCCLASTGTAQITDDKRQTYSQWLQLAQRAETAIDSTRASEAAFEALRQEIVQFREVFVDERSNSEERIKTLESQLDALGPEPEEGGEPEDIATLRKSLNDSLTQIRVPRIVAEEAFSRANGLISEIDNIVRERRKKTLLERFPSPLNPEHWPIAWRDVTTATKGLWNETELQIDNSSTREKIQDDLPLILGLVGLSLVLLTRGRTAANWIGNFLRRAGGQGTGVWTFIVSIVEVGVVYLGVILLVQAIVQMDVLGVRGTLLLDSVPQWAITLLAFHWLGDQLFSKQVDNDLIPVGDNYRRQTRVLIDILGVMVVLQDASIHFHKIENVSQATQAVVAFPIILVTTLILLRLRRIGLKQRGMQAAKQPDTAIAANTSRIVNVSRQVIYLLAVIAPLLACVGYINAAEALVYPALQTLALLTTLMILQRFLGDLYGWLSGKGEAGQDSLIPIMFGFLLTLTALPLFALIWGARTADLTEVWTRFLGGFTIGGTTISPSSFVLFAMVFGAGYTATRLIQSSLRTTLLPKTAIDPGGQNAIVSGTGYVGIFLAALAAITWAGLDLSSLAIVAGALSVGIGFGLQTIVSNFVSGIILLIERPISKGDWIDVNGQMGYVRDISVRSTRIETFDRTDVIIPNSDLITGTVTNYTRGNTVGRVIVPVGVAYGTDPRKIETILREIANAHPMVLANPAPNIVFQGFGADSLDFEIRAILRDVNWVLSVRSDMNFEIAKRFDAEGIEIPFAQRDVWFRNAETLTAAAPKPPDPTDQGA